MNGKLNNDVILFENCYLTNPGNAGYQLYENQILWQKSIILGELRFLFCEFACGGSGDENGKTPLDKYKYTHLEGVSYFTSPSPSAQGTWINENLPARRPS